MNREQLFLNTFKQQFEQLRDNLLKLTNNDTYIKINFNKIDSYINLVGLKTVVLLFNKELGEYENQLLSRDENFFLNLEIEVDQLKTLGNTLKNIYKESTQENKDMLYKYVELLYKISKKIKKFELNIIKLLIIIYNIYNY